MFAQPPSLRTAFNRCIIGAILVSLALGVAACGDDSGQSPDDEHQGDTGMLDTTQTDAAPPDMGSGTIDINGTVVNSPKSSLEGIQVGLLRGRTTSTDSEGEFIFENVSPPYDVVIIARGSSPTAVVYRGLTRPDPVLHHPNDSSLQTSDATITGSFTDGLFSQSSPPDFDTAAGFRSSNPEVPTAARALSTNDPVTINNDGTFSATPEWVGSSSVTGKLAGLQWEVDANGDPTTYTGFGSSPEITVNQGDMLNQVEVPLDNSVTDVSVDAVISAPDDYEVSNNLLIGTVDGTPIFRIESNSDSNFQLPVPSGDSVGAMLFSAATSTMSGINAGTVLIRTDVEETTDILELDVQAPPEIAAPANNATGIDSGSTISYQNFQGGAHVVRLEPDSGNGTSLSVVTTDTSTPIPDLTDFGYSLTPNTQYSLIVVGIGPAETIDATATAGWAGSFSIVTGSFPTTDAISSDADIGISPTRTVTSAP